MKTSKTKRTKKPTCPKCGSPLRIAEADPSGRPMCTSASCAYVGAATKTPPAAKWGEREDAHLSAVKKWLSEGRTRKEIEAIKADPALLYKCCGYAPSAWKRAAAILEQELHDRDLRAEGVTAKRTRGKMAAEANATPATPTPDLETEIIRILNRDFQNTKAHPTAAAFYQAHVINGRSMTGLSSAKGWKLRTMKKRKADIEAHLSRTFRTPVDLNTFKCVQRKSGRIVYIDPGIIERTHGDDATRPQD